MTITTQLDELTAAGLRVLAVAARTWSGPADDAMEHDLDLCGLLALQDPPRPDIADALARCRGAGIRVAMLSGDHPLTARRIATEVGLLGPGGVVLDGRDLPDDEELAALLDTDHGAVVARVSPQDKLRIARGLRERGHVVAMTGDGVNDAPALRRRTWAWAWVPAGATSPASRPTSCCSTTTSRRSWAPSSSAGRPSRTSVDS